MNVCTDVSIYIFVFRMHYRKVELQGQRLATYCQIAFWRNYNNLYSCDSV